MVEITRAITTGPELLIRVRIARVEHSAIAESAGLTGSGYRLGRRV
jgi:hypothetical protein